MRFDPRLSKTTKWCRVDESRLREKRCQSRGAGIRFAENADARCAVRTFQRCANYASARSLRRRRCRVRRCRDCRSAFAETFIRKRRFADRLADIRSGTIWPSRTGRRFYAARTFCGNSPANSANAQNSVLSPRVCNANWNGYQVRLTRHTSCRTYYEDSTRRTQENSGPVAGRVHATHARSAWQRPGPS